MKRRRITGLGLLVTVCVGVVVLSLGFVTIYRIVFAESMPRPTDFPSSQQPDQVCLTWSSDPSTTQTIQWRTSPKVKKGTVQFHKKGAPANEYAEKAAQMYELQDPGTANDPVNHRFTTVLDGLEPGVTYAYRVGGKKGWSEWSEFTTAPQTSAPFSFVYLGDPQGNAEKWGTLLHAAYAHHPEAAFYLVAGDNVNSGTSRKEWDSLFQAAKGVFDRRPYVPALGNHDYSKQETPKLYLDLLTLPENGPEEIGPERAYRFDYGNALFVVLDGNQPPDVQRPWLEQQLQSSKATWKFALFHQPAYSSDPERDNRDIREQWGSVFDQYHVDMALEGHDHGYLRTKPMRAGQEVASPAEGTVYIVSVSGTKHYDVGEFSYAAKTIAQLSTYQVIDIQTGTENKLTYRAYDVDGNLQDEFTIVK